VYHLGKVMAQASALPRWYTQPVTIVVLDRHCCVSSDCAPGSLAQHRNERAERESALNWPEMADKQEGGQQGRPPFLRPLSDELDGDAVLETLGGLERGYLLLGDLDRRSGCWVTTLARTSLTGLELAEASD